MRISVEEGDPGEVSLLVAAGYDIYFNGERMAFVLTADSEKGYMRAAIYPLEMDGNKLSCRDYFGHVEIISNVI